MPWNMPRNSSNFLKFSNSIPIPLLHLLPSPIYSSSILFSTLIAFFFSFTVIVTSLQTTVMTAFSSSAAPTTPTIVSPLTDQGLLLDKLQPFKIQGSDKSGRKILRIVGKFFPARAVNEEALKKYLEEAVFPSLGQRPFCVVYIHTHVQRSENFPGFSALRSIYEALPTAVKENLEAVYFVHPGLQARLFFATFGRFLFSGGLYGKLRYISRLEFLWDHVRRGKVDIPEFVYDHDEELEYRPLMDYGLESNHERVYHSDSPAMDSSSSMYSLRCMS